VNYISQISTYCISELSYANALSSLSGSYIWNKTEIKTNLFQVCFRRDCFISDLFQRLVRAKRNAETNRK